MQKHISPLNPDTYYHIYNRGINGCAIFEEPENYDFFMEKYAKYIPQVADTYAYCLLNNYFHFLIKTRTEEEIISVVQTNAERVQNSVSVSKIISLQLSHMFNSYTQAFNKQRERTGGLFETPFRRIEVSDENYFTQLIYYIHFNPQKHGFIADFREYSYSSYNSHISTKSTRLKREEVIDWFGDCDYYRKCHLEGMGVESIIKLELEF